MWSELHTVNDQQHSTLKMAWKQAGGEGLLHGFVLVTIKWGRKAPNCDKPSVQVAVFMYYGFQLDRLVLQVSSPAFLKSPLPYHPQLRAQAWRFLSYIFMHTGWVRVSSLNFQWRASGQDAISGDTAECLHHFQPASSRCRRRLSGPALPNSPSTLTFCQQVNEKNCNK